MLQDSSNGGEGLVAERVAAARTSVKSEHGQSEAQMIFIFI